MVITIREERGEIFLLIACDHDVRSVATNR